MLEVSGVDLSLTSTGLSGPRGWAPTTVKPGNLSDPERMVFIRKRVAAVAVRSDLVVIEDFAYGARGRSVFQIGGLGWIIRAELYDHRVPYVLLSPSTIKGFATGRGDADKYTMRREAERRLDVECANDDEADAVWMRAAGLDAYGRLVDQYGVQMPKSHRRFLAKVAWPMLPAFNDAGFPTGNDVVPLLGLLS